MALLVSLHVVFGLFFALTIVSTVRGLYLYWLAWSASRSALPAPAPMAVAGLVDTSVAVASGAVDRQE